MRKSVMIIACLFVIASISLVSARSDVVVWQGQYYSENTFNKGTYEFGFTIYDDFENGDICYSNFTNLTTGYWGQWRTEQYGVAEACADRNADYFLEIIINNETQGERRRLVIDYEPEEIDLSGYYTKDEIDSKGYLTSYNDTTRTDEEILEISSVYDDKNWVINYIESLIFSVSNLFVDNLEVGKSLQLNDNERMVCNGETEGIVVYDETNSKKKDFWGCRQSGTGEYEWKKL